MTIRTGLISTSALAVTTRNTPSITHTEAGRALVAHALTTVSVGTINTLYNLFVLPKGATVTALFLRAPDLDSNGSPTITLSLGDSGDDDRWLSASTVGQAGGIVTTANMATAGVGYTTTAETLVQLKLSAAAATLASGDVYVAFTYTVDNAATS